MDVQIEDGLAGLENLAVNRLDLRRELVAEDVAQSASGVLLRRQAVHLRERVVHANVVEARVHQRQADRCGREDCVDDGNRRVGFVLRGLGVAVELRVVDGDRCAAGEVLRDREGLLVAAAAALGRDEGDRAQDPGLGAR